MKKARIYLPLLGALIGLLPLLLHLVLTWVGPSHVSAPPYVLVGPVVVAVVFVVTWFRDVRAEADEASTMRSVLLWASLGIAVLVVTVAFSHLSGYTEFELFPGERYRLMPTVVATVAVGGFQVLLAAVAILLDRREHGIPGGGVVVFLASVLTLLVPAGAGVMAERALRPPQPGVEHLVARAESAAREIPTEIEGVPHALDVPHGAAWKVEALTAGVLFELSDGVMMVDAVTGEELWRYRTPGSDIRNLVAADGNSLVVEEYPPSTDDDPNPMTVRVTLDTTSGRVLYRSEDYQRLLADKVSPVAYDSENAKPLADESVVVRTGAQVPLDVYGASSGALLWRFQETPDCVPDEEDPVLDLEITQDVVIATIRCRGEAVPVVHAFDANTGELLWTHEAENSNDFAGSALTVSSDGAILYRYDVHADAYFTIDTRTGEELTSGNWQAPRPNQDWLDAYLWENVTGAGVLLGSDPTLTLTNAHGEPEHTLELPSTDGQRGFAATEEVLYAVEWPESGDRAVELTAHPWEGTAPHTVENVLGRELTEEEGAGVRVVPGGVIVYARGSGRITAAVAVT
ncbi:PQQ-binding-like beta-propeller repeat protein [Nocardiopsis halotolerans]|uniref:PQQ-binding-like beta-propeller repeat protein n=1 Tax=Nocardiopsis halotolerans TaxID=124252 RepID=UPI000367F99B|nr:PQQ-binding-like beta-propeller repeat protein [Nocardiopsis halotolerans]